MDKTYGENTAEVIIWSERKKKENVKSAENKMRRRGMFKNTKIKIQSNLDLLHFDLTNFLIQRIFFRS